MQTINGILILLGLLLFMIVAGVIVCLPRWLATIAGRALGQGQMDLIHEAHAERRAKLAEEARANPPPRPSALGYVAKRSVRPPTNPVR